MAPEEKMRLSTGFVRAAGYADKLRRTLLAQTKGIVQPNETVRTAAIINMRLFDVLRENNVEKGDVVRIMFNYEIVEEDGKKTIKVDWDSMTIEVYKNAGTIEGIKPPEEVERAVATAVVGEWREFEYDEDVFARLKLRAEEVIKTSTGYTMKGPDFEAEVLGKEKIRIKYTGPENKVNEFYAEILGG